MTADILRFFLIVAGLALVVGIYLWERRKSAEVKIRQIRAAVSREEPDFSALRQDGGAERPAEDSPADRDAPDSAGEGDIEQLEALVRSEREDHPPRQKKDQGKRRHLFVRRKGPQPRDDGQPPAAAAEPQRILQIFVVARHGARFAGEALQQALADAGLRPGRMDIYHQSAAGHGPKEALFSVASKVEPGSFPFADMSDFSTPGLAFFAQLPGPVEPVELFDRMVKAAERVAECLDGELWDETRSILSRQTVAHMREELQEYQRQQRLRAKG